MQTIRTALAKRFKGRVQRRRLEPADDFAAKLSLLASTPEQVGAVRAAIAPHAQRSRPAAGGFSCLEHVCHLRDIETDGYALRLTRILSEDRPSLPDLDGEALARERDYQAQDGAAACAAFAHVRAETVRRLAGTSAPERQRLGMLDGRTPFTLDEMVVAMLAHDAAHLRELRALAEELAERRA
jgi:hypothetical protein